MGYSGQRRLRWAAAAALGVCSALPSVAAAQTQGFALDRFDASERGSDWFVLDSLDFRGHVRPAAGLVLEYAYLPLAVYDSGGALQSGIVQDSLVVHPGASLVLWDRLRVGFDLPIFAWLKFRFNSAELDPASDPILAAVATILEAHPDIVHVRIEGHTDSKGAPAYNLALSQRRAASVLKWLASHGIEKKRLESQGFGMTKPIDDNGTDDGRRNNRRVEFHIVEGPVKGAAPK